MIRQGFNHEIHLVLIPPPLNPGFHQLINLCIEIIAHYGEGLRNKRSNQFDEMIRLIEHNPYLIGLVRIVQPLCEVAGHDRGLAANLLTMTNASIMFGE
jgi:hypothetical protein